MSRRTWIVFIGALVTAALARVAYAVLTGAEFPISGWQWAGAALLIAAAGLGAVTLSRWGRREARTPVALADAVVALACMASGYMLLTADPGNPPGWAREGLLLVALLAGTVRQRLATNPTRTPADGTA
jgi:cation transport ATPase